jgi:hypothetical protein
MQFPLAIADLPFEFPVMREMIQYHRARSSDEGLRWLCNQLQQQAQASEA